MRFVADDMFDDNTAALMTPVADAIFGAKFAEVAAASTRLVSDAISARELKVDANASAMLELLGTEMVLKLYIFQAVGKLVTCTLRLVALMDGKDVGRELSTTVEIGVAAMVERFWTIKDPLASTEAESETLDIPSPSTATVVV